MPWKGMNMATSDAICIFGALEISEHLEDMRKEVQGVKEAADIEYIHRMRVASRRMRSALDAFEDCFGKKEYRRILKDARRVTRALGEARDLDVQLELLDKELPNYDSPRLAPGLKRLQMRMQNKREEAQKHVIAAMERMEKDKVLDQIEAWAKPLAEQAGAVYLYSPALYNLAFEAVNEEVDEFLEHEALIFDPANVTELHEMRIAAKHLRYTLEIFEEIYSGRAKPYIEQIKKIQDQLGSIHDLDVWIELIPQFIEEERERIVAYFEHDRPLRRLMPGLDAFKANKEAERQAQYEEFIEGWQKMSGKGTLEKLLRLVSAPLNIEAVMEALDKVEQANEAQETSTDALTGPEADPA